MELRWSRTAKSRNLGGKIALLLTFSKKLIDSASASETVQVNCKILFASHEGFLKLENDLEDDTAI